MAQFVKHVLTPDDTRRLPPELARSANPRVWVYRYSHPREAWTLSIATHAEPGSKGLSLGGFRIAPHERTSLPSFSTDHEAVDLAIGMEEKVYWSRLIRVGGPLAQRDFNRIVGGKCVLLPTPDARVGKPRDFELLDFAIACLNDCESSAGIHITTGQDLGHGTMSDGRTQSLHYLNAGFPGSVVADTSRPTAEGNYYTLRGMLHGLGIEIGHATIGFIGCGNIGAHVLRRALEEHATVIGVEMNAERRAALTRAGAEMLAADQKQELLRRPIDALVVNASGGSLDTRTIDAILSDRAIKAICGSENLAMPVPGDAERLRAAARVYCPTELGGMMGYLTAVEEYLSQLAGMPFDVETVSHAAKRLEDAALAATRRVRETGFEISFEQAMRDLFEPAAARA
jgi:hypothetical protein